MSRKLSKEEIDRLYEQAREKSEQDVSARYGRAFPNDPLPLMHWREPLGPKLDALMEAAIKRGVALTDVDLLDAQGMDPAPPDAEV